MSDEATSTPVQQPIPSGAFKGSDLSPLVTDDPPNVLIVGAGLAGLFLGIYLEEAGIPYQIFERVAEIKPLGSIMCLSANIQAALEQLDLLDKVKEFSKPCYSSSFYTSEMKHIATVGKKDHVVGYDRLLFARPELYNLLFDRIPRHKIHMSKKLLSFQQNHEGVMLRFNDNTTIHGDVLVGADGAHSSVRQHLYKTLRDQDLLPQQDTKDMNKGYISVLGTTEALDPVKFPFLAEPDSKGSFIIGDNSTPYTWVTYTIPGNRICWNLIIQRGLAAVEDEQFRCSDYAPESNQKLLDEIRHYKIPHGTLGDLFDATPKDCISKVYYEDMLFETWTHGRTVLIGDAAHKILPSTGQGAVNAMQDAVILANCLYDIKPTSFENIKLALKDYKEQRFHHVKEHYAHSYSNAKLQYGHTWTERIFRYLILNWLPKSVMFKQIVRDSAYRPQANFMPQVPKRGSIPVTAQKASKRIQEEEAAKTAAVATAV
ncbi:hypothetical protein BGX29_002270 [Mortierella sp. GBA35]|nr:hypothetical protein BGX29_002270 [Mortierella sp. GBA35]